ncbi:MAG: hypothetical protein ACXWLM_01945 [Myxococcales bacterium]
MKTLFASLLVAAAACGGQKSADQKSALAECTYTMPADTSPAELRQAIADAQSGLLDPCSGAVDLRSASVELAGIDFDDQDWRYVLRFRVFQRPPNEP